MKPEDFKFDLLEHAYALRRSAIARSRSAFDLDEKTCVWLVTAEAWREFQRSADILTGHAVIDFTTNRKRLLGIPVRVTSGDEEGTPPVQLLMEPMLAPKPRRVNVSPRSE